MIGAMALVISVPKWCRFTIFLLTVPKITDVLRAEFVQLVEMVDLDNVTFTKSVRFAENGTLLEDIHLLDTLYTASTTERHGMMKHEEEEKPTPAKKRRSEEKQQKLIGQQQQQLRLEARILMVADHSLHETFMKLYGQDEYAAYTALSRYMLGVFTQLDTIFARLSFSTGANSSSLPHYGQRIHFKLAGPPMIIFRPEDCPLRGPMLIALQQSIANGSSTEQMMPLLTSFSSDNPTTAIKQNETLLNEKDENELDNALANGVEGWNRLDALRAVQWIHRWIEHGEPMLPQRDHVMVLTRMDLISQRNDSATQGMAYVRAICRGADSVSISVVEDVGGLSTATVAAHELSHSLGAFHDGSAANANCSARQNFLMAPISASHTFSEEFGDTFPNAFVLSECSRHQIEQFLSLPESNCLWRNSEYDNDSGDNEQFADQSAINAESNIHHHASSNSANPFLAMKLEQRRMDEAADHQQHSSTDQAAAATGGDGGWWSTVVSRGHGKPGEQFDAGKQCQIVFGSHYGNCRRKDFMLLNADPCRRLWCKNRHQRRWAPCETKGFLPMMDGTRCGDAKWCVRGVCTAKNSVRKRSELRQTDDASNDCRDLNISFCASFTADQLRSFCRVPNFSRICCANCERILRQRKNKWKMIQKTKN